MLIAAIYDFLKRYAHYRAQLACIAALDERTLRDIGYSRTEMSAQAWRRAGLATG
jgi:uncharacterized protein YjiS (DUF1127 family)